MKVIIVEDVSKEDAYDIIQNSRVSKVSHDYRQEYDHSIDDSLNIDSLQEFIDFNKISEKDLYIKNNQFGLLILNQYAKEINNLVHDQHKIKVSHLLQEFEDYMQAYEKLRSIHRNLTYQQYSVETFFDTLEMLGLRITKGKLKRFYIEDRNIAIPLLKEGQAFDTIHELLSYLFDMIEVQDWLQELYSLDLKKNVEKKEEIIQQYNLLKDDQAYLINNSIDMLYIFCESAEIPVFVNENGTEDIINKYF